MSVDKDSRLLSERDRLFAALRAVQRCYKLGVPLSEGHKASIDLLLYEITRVGDLDAQPDLFVPKP
jgi:hypothetical protein